MKIISNKKYEELITKIRDLEFTNKQLKNRNDILDSLLLCDISSTNKMAILIPKENPSCIKIYDGERLLDISQCRYIKFEAYPNELPTLTIER